MEQRIQGSDHRADDANIEQRVVRDFFVSIDQGANSMRCKGNEFRGRSSDGLLLAILTAEFFTVLRFLGGSVWDRGPVYDLCG